MLFPLLQLHPLPKWPLVFFRIIQGVWDHLTASTLPGIDTPPCPREGKKWHTDTCWIFHTVNLFTRACAVAPGWSLGVLCIGYALNVHSPVYLDVLFFFYGLIAILSTASWADVPVVLSLSTPFVSWSTLERSLMRQVCLTVTQRKIQRLLWNCLDCVLWGKGIPGNRIKLSEFRCS